RPASLVGALGPLTLAQVFRESFEAASEQRKTFRFAKFSKLKSVTAFPIRRRSRSKLYLVHRLFRKRKIREVPDFTGAP
ncbi:MAG: hypothetical protein WAK72_16790, partial [Pseudolabrys sp.]